FLLTGQPPFPGGNLAEKVARHMHAEPPALDKFRKDLPTGLSSLVRKMLAKRQEDRYQTPDEVAQLLTPHSDSGRSVAAKWQLIPQLNWRNWCRRRLLVGLMAGLVVAVLVPAGLWLFGPTGFSPLDELPAGHDPQYSDAVAVLGQSDEPRITK